MDTNTLQIFVEVVRRGSFAAVARDRDMTPSTISRAVAALEDELGVRLFQRSTRRLDLTEAGILYLERIEPLVEELQRARHMVADMSETPRGLLRITAPVSFGQLMLLPVLPELAEAYPELSFDLRLTDAMEDILADRIDVALRTGALSDSGFIASRLCAMALVVCASPRYLERYGKPTLPASLRGHQCLCFPIPGWRSRWRFRDHSGNVTEEPVRSRVIISNGLALKQCVLADMGVALLPQWFVWRELRDGALLNLFPDYETTGTEFDEAVWLLYPSRHYLPLKVRVFVDFFKAKFSQGAPWEA
ncbi:MAG: LysR family transcriptional regulator [Sulfuricellaceae bacterium]|nr:LysR family transcriptional regulator [Sulfuricellaceae bacterium]